VSRRRALRGFSTLIIEIIEGDARVGKLTLDGLEILDAIDRRGSFSAAADELHKVPSTISYTVAKLEEDLKVTLFRRSGPRIAITEAGRELLREGRLLLQAASDLECRVQRVASGWESTFQIAVDTLIPAETLSPQIAAFDKVADATRLRITEEALTGTWECLLDARCDLAIVTGVGPAGGGYLTKEVARIDFWFCVARFHPLARAKEPLTETQIRAHRGVVVADSARRLPARSAGLLSGQRTITVPTLRAKVHLQAEGLGVGYLPAPCAEQGVRAGWLVRKLLEVERAPETLSVAWRLGAQGKALDWWLERLANANAMTAVLSSASHAYAARHANVRAPRAS
jgi:DNA-binding transcriptional LysR family regulator